jgi:hypothetical protein
VSSTSEPTPRRLRIALLLDSTRVAAWVRAVVEEIAASPHAELALVVRRRPRPQSALPSRIWQRRPYLVYELYARLDRRLFPNRPDPFARRSLDDLLGGVPVIEVEPLETRFSDRFSDRALSEIRRHDLDVALRFGFRILRGGALEIARHGVWSYHHDDPQAVRGAPPCFWEVMERHPVTGSVLQVLSEKLDAGRVLYRSWSTTHRRSVARNKAQVYWKSAAFVGRCLRQLAESGDAAAGAARREAEPPAAEKLHRKPRNVHAAFLVGRHAVRAVTDKLLDAAARKQWFLAFQIDPAASREATALDAGRFRFTPILPPRDRFWADPFPVPHGDGWAVFFEEYVYAEHRGRLAVLELDRAGRWTAPRPVLEAPHHLSYPFVFEWRGERFMVPESSAARRVELCRAADFPDRWQPEAVLLDGVRAVDATLHEAADGRWWMFANVARDETPHAHDELHLFHADSPLGPWRPHRRNPVVSDARHARPAGRVFSARGDLFRPAQDCSYLYGYAVALQRVRRLDLTDYEEETVSTLLPRWRPGLLATHTYNRCPGLTMVDGLRRVVGRKAR